VQKLYPLPDELALQSILKDMKIAVDKFKSDLLRTEGADAKRTKYDPISSLPQMLTILLVVLLS
jgi:hypothetical protein